MVAVEGDRDTIPTSLFFPTQASAPPLFGREAIDSYLAGDGGRLLRGLKNVLGTPLMKEETGVSGKRRSFYDILSIFISHLKDRSEQHAESAIDNVVIGRPVHFHDDKPDADQMAQDALEHIAKGAGFKNILFQYEPIAAAFSHEQSLRGENLSLVIDLGGGTSDFTVIRLSSARKDQADRHDDILATAGVRVGGTLLDHYFSMGVFMPPLGLGTQYRDLFDRERFFDVPAGPYADLSEWVRIPQIYERSAISNIKDVHARATAPEKIRRFMHIQEKKLGHAFLQRVEGAKIDLAHHLVTQSDFDSMELDFSVSATRQDFETIVQAPVERIFKAMNECLSQAGLRADQIDLIILTGGTTELPVINHYIGNKFPQARISNQNKFSSVAHGLGYNARAAFLLP